jgi:hypothetical protein
MKKLILTFFFTAICIMAYSQEIDSIIENYKTYPGAIYHKIDEQTMGLLKSAAASNQATSSTAEFLNNVTGMSVLNIKEAKEGLYDEIRTKGDAMLSDSVKKFDQEEDGKKFYIIYEQKNDKITNALVVINEKNIMSLLQMKGSFTNSDFDKFINLGK